MAATLRDVDRLIDETLAAQADATRLAQPDIVAACDRLIRVLAVERARLIPAQRPPAAHP